MLQTSFGELLLRQIPAHLVEGVSSGKFQVYGSIIRSVADGRIVAHLQETHGLARMAGHLITAPGLAPAHVGGLALDGLGHAVTYVQNEQIKAAVATLNSLQVANLALGAVQIGVSVAGLAILAAKMSRIEKKVEGMSGTIEAIARGVESLRMASIRDDFTRLRTAVEQLEEGWTLADPVVQWSAVARESHKLANAFESRASELLSSPETDALAAEPFIEAFGLASATRVCARLAAGEDLAARDAAERSAVTLVRLGDEVKLGHLALQRLHSRDVMAGTPAWSEGLDEVIDELRPQIAVIRQREYAAVSTALTLKELESQHIPGRGWLEAARMETEAQLLCLLPRFRAAA